MATNNRSIDIDSLLLMPLNLPKRFLISFILCIPIFLINFGGNYLGWDQYISLENAYWIQMILSLVIVWGCGSFLFSRALKSIFTLRLNMFTLVGIAASLLWFYSLFGLLRPEMFPPSFHQTDTVVPVYFDAVSYVIMFVILGQYLEMKARLQVTTELFRCIRKIYPAAQADQIRNFIKNSLISQLPLARQINTFTHWFILLVLIAAGITFTIWNNKGPQPSALFGLITALSVMLAASPCALSLSAPVSLLIGLKRAAIQGVIINNPDLIETLQRHHNVKDLITSGAIITLKRQPLETLSQAGIILTDKVENAECTLPVLADKIMHNIYKNFAFALAYNILILPIAAGILYPFSGFLLGPVTASIAMSVSSLMVILNALRLRETTAED